MSKKYVGFLIALFLLTSVFIEAVALFALWNAYFKIAIAQWAVWTAGMLILVSALAGAWEQYQRNQTEEGGH